MEAAVGLRKLTAVWKLEAEAGGRRGEWTPAALPAPMELSW
jgi:hypothetical protein